MYGHQSSHHREHNVNFVRLQSFNHSQPELTLRLAQSGMNWVTGALIEMQKRSWLTFQDTIYVVLSSVIMSQTTTDLTSYSSTSQSYPPTFFNLRLKTYPNLTACSSGTEPRICIFLVPFERKHRSLCKCELNVGEYNTIDLVQIIQ